MHERLVERLFQTEGDNIRVCPDLLSWQVKYLRQLFTDSQALWTEEELMKTYTRLGLSSAGAELATIMLVCADEVDIYLDDDKNVFFGIATDEERI